ncbi:hypothetical protein KM043_013158 [Ampulex compressa]|nr:hypothetical protein KM043_013158 [Ampulex compressa]
MSAMFLSLPDRVPSSNQSSTVLWAKLTSPLPVSIKRARTPATENAVQCCETPTTNTHVPAAEAILPRPDEDAASTRADDAPRRQAARAPKQRRPPAALALDFERATPLAILDRLAARSIIIIVATLCLYSV